MNIKKQEVEIISFDDFVNEITKAHLEYINSQIHESDFDRLKKSLEEKDVVEISAIIKHWRIDLNDIRSGMFRKYVRFTKKEDGYILSYDDVEFLFTKNQALFILASGDVILISIFQKDYLTERI